MPPGLLADVLSGASSPELFQNWARENSGPCPHGITFEQLRERLHMQGRLKSPKFLRAYLEDAIRKGVVRVEMTAQEIRYVEVRAT